MTTKFTAMYWSDFMADTDHLTNEELGVYTRLLGHYYLRGPGLPANPQRLGVIARCPDQEVVGTVLAEFFQAGDLEWRHRRADKEMKKAKDLSEARSHAARCRWNANASALADANAYANAVQEDMHTECKPDKEHSVVSSTDSDESVLSTTGGVAADPVKEFFDFGVSMLHQGGVPARQARSILGKIRKHLGDKDAFALILKAREKTDPVPYLMAAAQRPGLPRDQEGLIAHATKYGLPQANPGETTWQWRERLERLENEQAGG